MKESSDTFKSRKNLSKEKSKCQCFLLRLCVKSLKHAFRKLPLKSHVTSYYSLLMIIQVSLIFASSVGINLGMPHSKKLPLKSTVSPRTFVL